MLIESCAKIIKGSGCLEGFWGKLDEGSDATLGVAASARPFLISAYFSLEPRPTLVIVAGEDAANNYARSIAAYIGEENVLLFPERKDRPFLCEKADPRVVAKRLEAAYSLNRSEKKVVVSSAGSLLKAMPPVTAGVHVPLTLECDREIEELGIPGVSDLDGLKVKLESMGYTNTNELDGPGTFASHGGSLDIHPGNLDYPIRLDFFGDLLEEIRQIVPSTGQMISTLSSVRIFAVTEFPLDAESLVNVQLAIEKPSLTDKNLRRALENLQDDLRFDGMDILLSSLFDSLTTLGGYTNEDSISAIVEPRSLIDDAQLILDKQIEAAKGTGFDPMSVYFMPAQLDLGNGVRSTYLSLLQVGVMLDSELRIKRVDVAGNYERLFGKLRNWLDAGFTCLFSIPGYRARKDMELELVDHSIPIKEYLESDAADDPTLKRSAVNIVDFEIPLGMVIPDAKLTLLSIEDTKGSKSAGKVRTRIDITDITFPYSPGDYVVHSAYGIALFKDIVRREFDGELRDYIELHYAEGDKLFLPIEQFDKITKYVGVEGEKPRITRLDSADWSRAITKARKATKKLAFDLIDVYARRAASKGYRFEIETPWLHSMEESFPYNETPDQSAAIADVKADMHSIHPMDRLICGDVGFGKTEVALRAAFIAAQNKKQVMVLCPTTILAQQHYTNFKERFEPFGIKVEILSRFRSQAQQRAALEGFSTGEVSVLIGTHRLLSADVNPRDLGLVIIDEEQRFGVGHKEQFKNLRESIDVLTLSATPIPRTMQMAVSGVRDMSLILTPPDDRLPVKVHVGEWDPDLVQAAIRYELERNGQVYYVSNRVRTINEALDRVHEAAPEARIGMAHGKMSKEQLEHVMEDFSAGLLDVLVATTIIESGIDNPHTNTLIIEDSQRLGLAQMYQLKGRVGRSHVQAYAYFMFPEEMPLTEDAHARLMALSEHQELGSGMRIAMRDLEIRGAGSMLGAEQSGNMSSVGFDLFAQMLNQAVQDAREGTSDKRFGEITSLSDISINLPGNMYIPEDYIKDIDARVMWYRRLANASSSEDVDELESSILAMDPDMPIETRNLFDKARLKAFANEHGISNINASGGKINIDPIKVDKGKLANIKRIGGRYLSDKRKLIIPIKYFEDEESKGTSKRSMLIKIREYLESIFGDGRKDDTELSGKDD